MTTITLHVSENLLAEVRQYASPLPKQPSRSVMAAEAAIHDSAPCVIVSV
jgi:hypothetical protein